MVKNNTSGGISFCGLLTIVFIALKLTGGISWSWWWVLAPLWIPLLLMVSVCIIITAIAVWADVPTHFTRKFKKD